MILTTAAFLSILGFIAWGLGHVFEYRGIAALGAALVLGVGAAAMVGGLEVQDGEERIDDGTGTVTVENTYDPVGVTTSFPLGVVVTLLGGVMTLRAVESIGAGV